MICTAKMEHLNEITALWDIAFGEDKAFNDYFFKNIFDIENTLLCIEENAVVAMTQAIPYHIDGVGMVSYIYGAATHPDFRDRGIMANLLNYSFQADMDKGFVGSMLIPAEKSLFDYYRRFGYETAFYTHTFNADAKKINTLRPVSSDDIPLINDIYESSLKNIPHPKRSYGEWSKQLKMFNALGGYCYTNENSYAFGWNGDTHVIQEILGNEKESLASAIADKIGVEKISATTVFGNTYDALGMLKLYNGRSNKMYFNLMYN